MVLLRILFCFLPLNKFSKIPICKSSHSLAAPYTFDETEIRLIQNISHCSNLKYFFPFIRHNVLCTRKNWSFLIAVCLVSNAAYFCTCVYIADCTTSHSDIVYSSYTYHHENRSCHFVTYLDGFGV